MLGSTTVKRCLYRPSRLSRVTFFCDHGLLEPCLGRHFRKQNSNQRSSHSPLPNNGAAICVQEDIKKKSSDEKRPRLYNVGRDARIRLHISYCVFFISLFISLAFYILILPIISPPSLMFLIWLLPHSSKTHPTKIFLKILLSKLQKLMSMGSW